MRRPRVGLTATRFSVQSVHRYGELDKGVSQKASKLASKSTSNTESKLAINFAGKSARKHTSESACQQTNQQAQQAQQQASTCNSSKQAILSMRSQPNPKRNQQQVNHSPGQSANELTCEYTSSSTSMCGHIVRSIAKQ